MAAEFVHLHVHSEYSLLDGAAQLDKLVERARALEFKALAVTDHGNLFGAIDFYQAARAAGIKPILGCELYVAPGGRRERAPQDGSYEGANHLTVLARNAAGYRNLMRLVSRAYLEGYYYKPRVDRELLAEHADGLVALSGCLNSEVAQALEAGDEERAAATAGWYRETFGREHYFLEVQAHGLDAQVRVNAGTLGLSRRLGIPIVGTNDSHYLEAGHARAHEALLCIQTGTTLTDPDRFRFSTNEFYLKSAEEMARVFRDVPDACRNTLAVAEQCDVALEFGRFHLPRYATPAGEGLDAYLERLAREGLVRRYGASVSEAVEARLAHELAVIAGMGFAGYFLVVWDFVAFARARGITVGPGRGSSAGSLVAYALGITSVDPVRYGLLFERFLNPERVSLPDMDIDFADDRRDEVIRYVADRYGRDRVAHIITFGTLGAKAAIRDVGRVLGLPYAEADRMAKLVPGFPLDISLDEAWQKSPPLADLVRTEASAAELWELARTLEGCTRHASVHASAVVISDEPLEEHIPLYKDPKRPELITGYAMGPIEQLGLLKTDFLGLRTLTVIAEAASLVRRGRGIALDMGGIPLDDPLTYRLLGEARTGGVFQLESTGMRDALRGLRPDRFEDIIAIVSLYRPGPMQLIPEFIGRRHGRTRVTYEHPAMERITRETYGILVYQEQIMQLAADMAGFSLGAADLLRRAMGKKDRELMAEQRTAFLEGAAARGTDAATGARVWELMEKFAGYGFNKSHAAAYALVAYQTAWLKTNYPLEYMAALLSSESGDTDKIVKYVEECRSMGIAVCAPDVNSSDVRFAVDGSTIRFGLAAIRNVGAAAIEGILLVRQADGPFQSLEDFAARIDQRQVNRRVVESLIKAGAFDSVGAGRGRALAALDGVLEAGQRLQRDRIGGQGSLFDTPGGHAPAPAVASAGAGDEWDEATRLEAEREVLGFYVSGHPLARLAPAMAAAGATPCGAVSELAAGTKVILVGIPLGLRETATRSGKRMAHLSLEDMSGAVEVTVFPEVFRSGALVLRGRDPVVIRGRVEDPDRGRQVVADEVRPFAPDAAERASGAPTAGGPAAALRVTVPATDGATAVLAAVRAACTRHPGMAPVFVHVLAGSHEVVVRARNLMVAPSDGLAQALAEAGAGVRVLVEHGRPA